MQNIVLMFHRVELLEFTFNPLDNEVLFNININIRFNVTHRTVYTGSVLSIILGLEIPLNYFLLLNISMVSNLISLCDKFYL